MPCNPQDSVVTSSQDEAVPMSSGRQQSRGGAKMLGKKTAKVAPMVRGGEGEGEGPGGGRGKEAAPADVPWMDKFVVSCCQALGSHSHHRLDTLMDVYHRLVSRDVKCCFRRPKRAHKLKCLMNQHLNLFYMLNADVMAPIDNDQYLERMTQLLSLYLDMELKASRSSSRREGLNKVSERLISMLFILLDNKMEYIIEAVVESKLFGMKKHNEICLPIVKKLHGWLCEARVKRRETADPHYHYVNCVLLFRKWKKMVAMEGALERGEVCGRAAACLPPPPGFTDLFYGGKARWARRLPAPRCPRPDLPLPPDRFTYELVERAGRLCTADSEEEGDVQIIKDHQASEAGDETAPSSQADADDAPSLDDLMRETTLTPEDCSQLWPQRERRCVAPMRSIWSELAQMSVALDECPLDDHLYDVEFMARLRKDLERQEARRPLLAPRRKCPPSKEFYEAVAIKTEEDDSTAEPDSPGGLDPEPVKQEPEEVASGGGVVPVSRVAPTRSPDRVHPLLTRAPDDFGSNETLPLVDTVDRISPEILSMEIPRDEKTPPYKSPEKTPDVDLTLPDDSLGKIPQVDLLDKIPPVEPANYVDSGIQPADYVDSRIQPKDYVDSKTQPADYADSRIQSVDYMDSRTKPTDYVDSTIQPADYVDSRTQPADYADSRIQTADYMDSRIQPADYVASRIQPADYVDSRIQTADYMDSRIQPADYVDSRTQPADNVDSRIQPADNVDSRIQPADYVDSRIQPADYVDSRIQPADYVASRIQPADYVDSRIQPADYVDSRIQPADYVDSRIQPADYVDSRIQPADYVDSRIQPAPVFPDSVVLPEGTFEAIETLVIQNGTENVGKGEEEVDPLLTQVNPELLRIWEASGGSGGVGCQAGAGGGEEELYPDWLPYDDLYRGYQMGNFDTSLDDLYENTPYMGTWTQGEDPFLSGSPLDMLEDPAYTQFKYYEVNGYDQQQPQPQQEAPPTPPPSSPSPPPPPRKGKRGPKKRQDQKTNKVEEYIMCKMAKEKEVGKRGRPSRKRSHETDGEESEAPVAAPPPRKRQTTAGRKRSAPPPPPSPSPPPPPSPPTPPPTKAGRGRGRAKSKR